MSLGDFLRKNAQTSLREHYLIGGTVCAVSTNFEPILDAAGASFRQTHLQPTKPVLSLRFWVDPKGTTQRPWPKPFFRGIGNLIFAGFDAESSMLIDLRRRRAIGRFSPAMGADTSYWKTVILPVLVSVIGPSVGITELHCGCVAKHGDGLLLAGRSGSGKSTLALAMARQGYAYVSDDRTFCSEVDGRLFTWGLPTTLKIRPPSAEFFEQLRTRETVAAPNGERAFLIKPDYEYGIERIPGCNPRWLVFLERQGDGGFHLAPLSSSEAARRLEEDLIAEGSDAANLQRKMIAEVTALPCWIVRYGDKPQSVANELARRFERETKRTCYREGMGKIPVKRRLQAGAQRLDPLGRFTPSPFISDLQVMGRTIRLETNTRMVSDRARALFARYGEAPGSEPDFVWKILCKDDSQKAREWPRVFPFSDKGLRFLNIGQRSFLAVDLESREGAGYLGESLIEDQAAFVSPFLTILFCMTAGALGLTTLAAACVKLNNRGLLVLGKPNNGKTTSSYLAARSGLEFYADQSVFLDWRQGGLCAWGDFAPAAFRVETSAFLPELKELGNPFHYHDRTFLYIEESTSIPHNGDPVVPVSCIFLERGVAAVPRLTSLNPIECYRRLEECLPFEDDERFDAQHSAALSALAEARAYLLCYGDNPADAARFFPDLLSAGPQEFQEGRGQSDNQGCEEHHVRLA